jgi:hypothetical protein
MNKTHRQFLARGRQPPLNRRADREALELDLTLKGAKWRDIGKLCGPIPAPKPFTRGSVKHRRIRKSGTSPTFQSR